MSKFCVVGWSLGMNCDNCSDDSREIIKTLWEGAIKYDWCLWRRKEERECTLNCEVYLRKSIQWWLRRKLLLFENGYRFEACLRTLQIELFISAGAWWARLVAITSQAVRQRERKRRRPHMHSMQRRYVRFACFHQTHTQWETHPWSYKVEILWEQGDLSFIYTNAANFWYKRVTETDDRYRKRCFTCCTFPTSCTIFPIIGESTGFNPDWPIDAESCTSSAS